MLDTFLSFIDWLAYKAEIAEELFFKALVVIFAVSLAATLGIAIFRALAH